MLFRNFASSITFYLALIASSLLFVVQAKAWSLSRIQQGRSCQSRNNAFLDYYFVRRCGVDLWCNSQEVMSKGEKCLLDEGRSCKLDGECTNNLVCSKGVCGCQVNKRM